MPNSSSLWWQLRKELRARVPHLFLGALFLAATNVCGLAVPRFLRDAIDGLSSTGMAVPNHDSVGAVRSEAEAAALSAASIIVLLAVGQALARTASRILVFNSGRFIEHRLRGDLWSRILASPSSAWRELNAGDTMIRLTSDLSAVRMLVGPALLNFVNTTVVAIAVLPVLFGMNARLAFFALVPIPALVVVGRLSSRLIHTASKELQGHLGRISDFLQTVLGAAAVNRLYNLGHAHKVAYESLSDRQLDKAMRLVGIRAKISPLFALIAGSSFFVVLWVGGTEVVNGRLTLGELVAFNYYLNFLSGPIVAAGWIISLWQRGAASWGRLTELWDATSPVDPSGKGTIDALSERYPSNGYLTADALVKIRELTLKLDNRTVLSNVNLEIAPNEIVALVGPTGAGKSLVADIILGLRPVPRGHVWVANEDVYNVAEAPLTHQNLRQRMAHVPQEPFLFSQTIRENIEAGGVLDPDRVTEMTFMSGLGKDLDQIPEGLEARLGQKGVNLSGGQRQRAALARALVRTADLFVFDDPLSAVDTENEFAILRALKGRLNGRAALIISHRPAAAKFADRVVVMNNGTTVGTGTHSELLASEPIYQKLFSRFEQEVTP